MIFAKESTPLAKLGLNKPLSESIPGPSHSPLPGGNGNSFDWTLLKNYNLDIPFFISGGIGLGHMNAIAEICKLNLPIHALDINSKFESEPGVKRLDDIKTFKKQLQL